MANILVQASGITYNAASVAGNILPPFAVSGANFNTPSSNGFTIGFLHAQRSSAAGASRVIASYGLMPNNDSTTTNTKSTWAVVIDTSDNIKMVLSKDGRMYFSTTANAAKAGSIECGLFRSNNSVSHLTETYKIGDYEAPQPNAFSHYIWSYDPTAKRVSFYLNGVLTDQRELTILNMPADPTAQILSFYFPQTSVWNWQNGLADTASVLTDVFYLSRPITASEARYVAFNGISDVVITTVSGVVGGYVQGINTASGVIGGYIDGKNTVSGVIGGYVTGSVKVSGTIGGYVQGLNTASGVIGGYIDGKNSVSGVIGGYVVGVTRSSGIIGGYIRGINTVSGVIGGYISGSSRSSGIIGGLIHGSTTSSGVIGGYIIGSLQGRIEFDGKFNVQIRTDSDFNAITQILKTDSTNFDAKVTIYQVEQPPLIGIIIPGNTVTGLVPPFNQYFIGSASGQQGKTIVQTRWTFGDSPTAYATTLSGISYYPISHSYAQSGFFTVKFEAVDSNGVHSSATRIINVASGIPPVLVTLSGIPQVGNAELIVQFATKIEALPPNVYVTSSYIDFDNGHTSLNINAVHSYTETGIYIPIVYITDSRGILWTDSLEPGIDLLMS